MLKRDEIVRNQELVFHSADSDFEREKYYFLQFLVDILPLGFGSVDLHIFRIRIWIQEAIILWIQRIRIRIR